MATDSLPNIPTPPAQRWREFRIQVLPVMTFLTVLLMLGIMWRNFVQPAGIIGEVQPIRANVSSLQDGVIAELNVDLFEPVTKDQAIGRIILRDDDQQNAALESIKADLLLKQRDIDMQKTRIMDALTKLKVNLGDARIALSLKEIDMHFAEKDYERVKKLYDEGIVKLSSQDANEITLDTAERDRDKARQEVGVRRQVVAELNADYQAFSQQGNIKIEPMDPAIEKAIAAQTQVLKLAEAPRILVAPIAGRVSAIIKRAGEKVVRGEPILTISAPTSDRVIGYIRQPVNTVPTTNDLVKVRTRSQRRLIADCKIVHVGPSMEPINPALLSMDVQHAEMGLPILVALPSQVRLIPGEFVDLSIERTKK